MGVVIVIPDSDPVSQRSRIKRGMTFCASRIVGVTGRSDLAAGGSKLFIIPQGRQKVVTLV